MLAITLASQARAQSDAHKKHPMSTRTGGGTIPVAKMLGGVYANGEENLGFVTVDTAAKGPNGTLTTAYYGYGYAGQRVSPSAGRRAIGLSRAIIDVCTGTDGWDLCSVSDCTDTCEYSFNLSCSSSGPNNQACLDACNEARENTTLCNGGNDGL